MQLIDRSVVEPPECLANYNHPVHTWKSFGGACKSKVRAALVAMQSRPGVTAGDAHEYGVRCAYCEGAIHHKGHIEHFRRKNPDHFPELTFIWSNLFFACGATEHCGHYKDGPSHAPYDANHLIKPDEMDPEDYFYFHSSGDIRVKAGLQAAVDLTRASETVRVFGLNNPALSGARAKALKTYKTRILDDLEVITDWPPIEREAYLVAEVEATRWDPYATTIKHFLMKSA